MSSNQKREEEEGGFRDKKERRIKSGEWRRRKKFLWGRRFVVAWGARCGSGRDHGRRRRNQTKSKGDARVVAGRAGEGRHQLRRDYKRERARGADRGRKKKRRRPTAVAATFYTDGKKNSREPHEIHETFPFCFCFFSFRSFVLLLFWSWPFFFFFSFDDFKTPTRIRQMEKTFDFIWFHNNKKKKKKKKKKEKKVEIAAVDDDDDVASIRKPIGRARLFGSPLLFDFHLRYRE